jgi:cytochrome c
VIALSAIILNYADLKRSGVLVLRLACVALLSGAVFAGPAFAQTAAPGDAARGKIVFLECQACHAVAPGRPALVGPNLRGVFGRAAGAVPGYDYSQALKASGITWTPVKLDAWLTDPGTLVPGTKMAFTGIASAALRADVIAYLQTLR